MAVAAITGSNGFVGAALASAFAGGGWDVIGLCRHPDVASHPAIAHRKFELERAEATDLHSVDVLVHCAIVAYRADGAATSVNVAGSERLFAAARAQGVKRIVFVSSTAARPDSVSPYGREKFAIEQQLDPRTDLIVRPGLVIGAGGLFEAMCRLMRRLHVAPLFFGGRKPVYTVGIDELAFSLVRLVSAEASGIFVLAAPAPIPMKEMYEGIARKAGTRAMLLSLPYTPTLWLVSLLERAGVPLPISSGSMRGIASMQPIDVPTYGQLGGPMAPFEASLSAMPNAVSL